MLEWILEQLSVPSLDAAELKSLLILGADRKEGISYPSREWGYGTLNLANVFFNKSVNFKERNFREKKPVDQFIKSLDLNRGIFLLRRKGSGIIDERKVWNCKSEQLGRGGIQMRDFFEDLGKRLGETAESLTNRASEVVEVQRIRDRFVPWIEITRETIGISAV